MKLRSLINVKRQRWNKLGPLLLLISLSAVAGGPAATAPGFEARGALRGPTLTEVSGLAVSPGNPDLLWAVNDSGNAATLQALDHHGALRAEVLIGNAINLDWEDLAAYQEAGQSWLVIGDIGDNLGWRGHLSLYRVAEPGLDQLRTQAVEEIRFRFEDGPRDCESLAVDLANRRYLLLDKGRTPVGLYALAMDGPPQQLRIARRLADLPPLLPSRPQLVEPLDVRWRGSPTAMSLSADGRRMLVLTYSHVLLFEREAQEDWAQALQRPPLRRVRLPAVDGFEAATLSADGVQAWLVNEGKPGWLYHWTGAP